MKVNRRLIWDYPRDTPADDEAFRRWYVARVLTRGGIEDVRAVGLGTVREYLPSIVIPRRIREFWEWFFSPARPDGDPHPRSARGH